jgi:hypothetical protein
MKRLLPRPPRRRAESEEPAASTEVQPVEPTAGAPAGAEPEDPAAPPRPSFRNRGRLRRRLRYLRRVRELGFRDLGGLVFEQHKFSRPNEALVRGKLTALAAVDTELRALEEALRDRRDVTELREAGVSACPRCGTLHASDARYCPSCGLSIRGSRAIAPSIAEGAAAPQALPEGAPPEPAATHTAEREAGKPTAEETADGPPPAEDATGEQATIAAPKREP